MRPIFQPAIAAATLACAAAALAQDATPCSDFDSFVNGRWTAATELPASRARIGSFDTLRMANDKLLETALAELAAAPARQTTPGLKLLAAYYRSGMDTAAIEKQGLSSAAQLLTGIAALRREDLPGALGLLARLQLAAPFALSIGPDAKDGTRNALYLSQSGLGLPDREDYFRNDANSKRLIGAYRTYARRLLEASGAKADEVTLDALMVFETELAQASMTRVQRRDPKAVYNPSTAAGLQTLAPGFDWQAWLFAYSGREGEVPVILGQPEFAKTVARLAQQAAIETWRSYLHLRLLDAMADHLPQAYAQARFDYRDAAVRGLKAPPSRVEQVILAIGGSTGGAPLAETLGELFVAKSFSPQAQVRSLAMLADIKAAMRQRVSASPWMSDPTKLLALAKLDTMAPKIGAPERWKTYEDLGLQPDEYAANLLRVAGWNTWQRLQDLDKPVDRARWNTSPHIVNAFAGSGNQIVFPAGILQPPFFDANADDASNYGAIGMVIGHEITHHFDDRGRQFDSVGNLRDWWTPADAAAYEARAARVAALYDSFEPAPGVHINGRLTLGENISDVGGIQIAYAGLQIALARERAAGKPPALIEGRTPEQRFFVANALIWRSKARPEALLDQLRTDGHSPGRWRILAPMSQMSAFAQAFSCKPGDAMVAADPILIW